MSSTRLKAKKCWMVWFLVTCLYLRTTLGQTVQSCPPRGEITPCSCSVKKLGLDIVCEFTDFLHINKAMSVLKGRSNTVIYYLKLRHNNLPKLQGFVFLGLDIHHLTVHNSSLAVVEESSLSSIGKGLTQLDISQNSLSLVPSSALKTLHHLLILNLNHNKINAIHAHAFEGLDTLEILTLYENKISIIDADAFKGVDNRKLKRLNLGGNQLTSVPTAALSTLEMLKKLEMQENRISAIQKGDFAGMKSLDSLGLAHNKLREVPAGVFSHLTQLNSLELEGNMITHVDPDAFMGLEENLQYLRLGDNNLHAVPSDALRRLHRLRHLDLRVNNITVLPEDAFFGYGDSITFLNLQKNLCLPSPFAKPTEYLEASQRALGYSLTGNFHIHMGEDPRRFWLAFDLVSIKTLPPMLFENLNSLETLNLQNNKMIHVPEEVMESVVDTLKIIDITDNPLVCDCELRWYSGWLKNLRDKDDEMMSKKRTVCTMVNEHREYSVQNIPLDRMGCMANAKQTTSSNVAVATKIIGFQVIVSMGFVILL